MTETPLVGAPAKIVCALNRYTAFDASCVIAHDYPKPLTGLFLGDAIVWTNDRVSNSLCDALVSDADVIHVHNNLPERIRGRVLRLAKASCRFVYQTHSPLREGPLFFDRSESLGFEFAAKLSIPHFPQRFAPRFRLVPNITLLSPSLQPRRVQSAVRILFSPAHHRRGLRWGDKVCEALDDALGLLSKMKGIEVLRVSGMPPTTLAELRRTTHISVDEIATGGFHQVSLEGLATGNVVVNNADYFAIQSLKMACRISEDPPFVRMDGNNVAQGLFSLAMDETRLDELRNHSHQYFVDYLQPNRLIQRFSELYEEVLDGR